jgi:hypothetical protein
MDPKKLADIFSRELDALTVDDHADSRAVHMSELKTLLRGMLERLATQIATIEAPVGRSKKANV